jgi:hypothetical protein
MQIVAVGQTEVEKGNVDGIGFRRQCVQRRSAVPRLDDLIAPCE